MKWFVAFIICIATLALAQQRVDQGKPGTQGPWPVKGIFTSGDGGVNIGIAPYQCGSMVESVSDAGTTAIPVPLAGNAANRVWMLVCNSAENTDQNALVKCRGDNTNPVMGTSNAGLVLDNGSCFLYTVSSGVRCISNASNIAVSTSECL